VADVPQPLDALASTANREHSLCEQASRSALAHAIQCGAALLQARAQVPDGEWLRWLAANFKGVQTTASDYMRLATYRDRLDPSMGMKEAVYSLSGLPAVSRTGRVGTAPEVREAAVAAVKDGATLTAVAEHFEVGLSTVHAWVNPGKRHENTMRYRARQRAAQDALRKQEREREIRRAVRKAGAALAEAYSMSCRMLGVLAQAEQEATNTESRAALEEARAHYHKMSDAIVRALGVS
jgi:transposase